MRCVACGGDLVPGKRFCPTCGTRVERACGTCGAALLPEYRYCPDCGSAVGAEAPRPTATDRLADLARHVPEDLARKIRGAGAGAGERKVVTVLFCDLVGSTSIAERLDPEEYRELLDRYLELAFQEIYRVDGIVNQLAGDGLMALFGAPVSHEDAPYRAVRAAWQIQERMRRFHAEAADGRGFDLTARIGIHTGPVVVGTVGNDLKMDYTAIGDTTNLAARLQTAADPGTIFVSETTYRIVRGFFETAEATVLHLKGKAAPVSAYRVLGPTAVTTSIGAAAARGLTPLVGRSSELEQLVTSLDRVRRRSPEIVAIVGDAGSGKSRLLHEFRGRLGADSCVLLEGRCSALTQSAPYTPFLGMFRAYFAVDPADDAGAAAERIAEKLRDIGPSAEDLHPILCRFLSVGGAAGDDAPADEVRQATFEALARIVAGIAERRPVVLAIEDLHWIDDASRELLEMAVSRLARAAVLMIFSHRPEFSGSWRAQVALTRLMLRPFSEEESRAMMRAVAGGALPAELEARILAKAEGSPFFTEEIVRTLLEEGWVEPNGDGHRLTRPLEELFIPGTVRELLAARLDRLGPAAKRVAQIGSVLGRQFRRRELAALAEADDATIDVSLGELERAGILHRKNALRPDEYRFGESLTQEVAYDGLLLRDRRRLHARAAELLSESRDEAGPHRLVLVAQHWARSEDRPKAARALLGAARETERLPSYGTAADYYRRAWEMAESALTGAGENDESLLRLAAAAALDLARMAVIYVMPDGIDVEAAGVRGRAIAERLGDVEALAGFDSYLGLLAMNASADRFDEGLELVRRGHATATESRLGPLARNLSRSLAFGYFYDGRLLEARAMVEDSIVEVEREHAGRPLPDFYFGLRWVHCGLRLHLDDYRGALEEATEVYGRAMAASNRTARAGMASVLALIHHLRGEPEPARRWADESLELGEAIGNVTTIRNAASIALAARAALRDGDDAERDRLLRLVEESLTTSTNLSLYARIVVDALLEAGAHELAARVLAPARAQAGGRLRKMLVAQAEADVAAALGDRSAARSAAARALALATEIGSRTSTALALLTLAEVDLEAPESANRRSVAEATFRELGLARHAARAAALRGAASLLPA